MKNKYLGTLINKGKYTYYKGMPCFANDRRLCSEPFHNDKGELCAEYYADNLPVLPEEANGEIFTLSELTPITFEEWKMCYCPAQTIKCVNNISTVLNLPAKPDVFWDYMVKAYNRNNKHNEQTT